MSRIAELRASLTSTVTVEGLPVLITRKEWAEFVREYKYAEDIHPARFSLPSIGLDG